MYMCIISKLKTYCNNLKKNTCGTLKTLTVTLEQFSKETWYDVNFTKSNFHCQKYEEISLSIHS